MQQETRLEETQMPKKDKCTAVGGTGLVKMHVSSVEDTIRPEMSEAPLRSAQSFWNPFKAPASDSRDQRGHCAILCQRYMLTDSYIPWNFLPSWGGPECMSLDNHDTSWYDVDALAPYVCVPGLLLLLQTPPAVLGDPVNPNSLLTHNHNLTILSLIYSLVMLAQVTWHPNQGGLLRLRMWGISFPNIFKSFNPRLRSR